LSVTPLAALSSHYTDVRTRLESALPTVSDIALSYGLELDDLGFESRQGLGFSSLHHQYRLRGSLNLLSIGYQGLFPWG